MAPGPAPCSLTGDLTEPRSRPAPRYRVALVATLLVTWVLGTALGTSPRVSPAAATPFLQLEQAHVGYVPSLDGSTPINILVLGSDARPGEQITGQRADSIHLVTINPEKEKATIVGFPRDSWVSIPGYGTNKINAAMTAGGPQLVVSTVENLMDTTIDYWALTWFDGFEAMINDIGGLAMDVPFEVYDSYAHAKVDAGRQRLTGRDALAYARARHALPQGDFGRSENQGRLIVAALAQFRKEFGKDPSRLLDWVSAGLQNMRTEVPLPQIVSLAFTASTLNPKKVVNVVLPGSTGTVGGTSIVNLNQATMQAIAKDLEGDGILSKKNIPPSPNAQLMPAGE